MNGSRYRLGIDVGGTFTDFVLSDGARRTVLTDKLLTTPDAPEEAVLAGFSRLIAEAGIRPADVAEVAHGTTLVTNSIIQRKGARTALVVTKGFRDVLYLRREQRYDIYDLLIEFPEPVVPRNLTFEVDERTDAWGRIDREVSEGEIVALAQRLADADVESVALCFLHSYLAPQNEQTAARCLQRELPQLQVSLSSQLLPQWREFDRATAASLNAFTRPVAQAYLEKLAVGLRSQGFGGRLLVITSNGGLIPPEAAGREPIRILESGPAGGALAVARAARQRSEPVALAFDMGGTTAKGALVRDGTPLLASEFEAARVKRFKPGSGFTIKLSVIDMIEIGAGGGSIARIDDTGLLSVGPESAGASPGPVCYGKGGVEPTVTDANLVLGYLNPAYFLGGAMPLFADDAKAAIVPLAERMRLSVTDVALGIIEIVSANMVDALRTHCIERNLDYRNATMYAFGGAGPLQAYRMALDLGIGTVVVPWGAGALSALGFLTAPVAYEQSVTFVSPLGAVEPKQVLAAVDPLRHQGAKLLGDASVPGVEREEQIMLAARYVGQGYEIEVELPPRFLETGDAGLVREAFEEQYRAAYDRSVDNVEVELVGLRYVLRGRPQQVVVAPDPQDAIEWNDGGSRQVYLSHDAGWVDCPVYRRRALAPETSFAGPALVEEEECTTFIGPGGACRVDQDLNLIVTVGRAV